QPPRHLRGLIRLDSYVLLRIGSGTGLVGYNDCEGKDTRHHWVECPRYDENRPDRNTLYKDLAVSAWKDWWVGHGWLRLGIPRHITEIDGELVVADNPFDETLTVERGGR